MDEITTSILHDLSGEMQALLDHDQEITGYSADDILIQSLFFHYPTLFQQFNLSVSYFVLLEPLFMEMADAISNIMSLDIKELIYKLFQIDNNTPFVSSSFPSYNILQRILSSSIYFTDFSETQRIEVLLEKLILQYHLMIQPEELVRDAFRADQNSYYTLLQIDLSPSAANILLTQSSMITYHVRRPGYEIKKRLSSYYKELKSFDILI